MKILRRPEFKRFSLSRKDLAVDPVVQFGRWFETARKTRAVGDASAMCVSTIGLDGFPNARWVLLKEFDRRGFVFYSNEKSIKGRELKKTPRAALTFYWEALERQVRIQGPVTRVTAAESDAYFASRPRISQLGAWASQQSEPMKTDTELEEALQHYRQKFGKGPIPRPPHWVGYRVSARTVEFWQGGANRLHHRFEYRRVSGRWTITRLNP